MRVLQQIHDVAVATPDKLAIAYNGAPVSYGRYWRLIDACRADLAARGLDDGLVLVGAHNIFDSWILNFALRSLGCDAVALHEPKQIALFAGRPVRAVITLEGERWGDAPPPPGAIALKLAPPSDPVFADDAPLPPFAMTGPFGAHILLTSGTTGASKPVPSRAGETDAALTSTRVNDQDPDPRFRSQGADAIFCLFDLHLWTAAGYTIAILAWMQGAGVVIDQRAFHLALQWPGITRATMTPYSLSRVLAAPGDATPYNPELRLVVWAGGISPAMAREARRRLTPLILNNVASTEVGIWGRTPIDSDDDLQWNRIVPGQVVEVVDEARHPLPPGRLGEVRIALVRPDAGSHLGDSATTAAQYTDGWFYPGDLGVFDERGRLSLRGRAADVVNIDGFKIAVEPWERELKEKLACDGVCILAGRFGGEDDRMHVFVETSAPISLERLTEAVQTTLRGYPGVHIHKLDAIPRTPMGKVRRIELAQQLNDGVYAVARAS